MTSRSDRKGEQRWAAVSGDTNNRKEILCEIEEMQKNIGILNHLKFGHNPSGRGYLYAQAHLREGQQRTEQAC